MAVGGGKRRSPPGPLPLLETFPQFFSRYMGGHLLPFPDQCRALSATFAPYVGIILIVWRLFFSMRGAVCLYVFLAYPPPPYEISAGAHSIM